MYVMLICVESDEEEAPPPSYFRNMVKRRQSGELLYLVLLQQLDALCNSTVTL